uniref:Glycosyltransferase n=1 Tax=Chlorobium chlorochromatii (strain CaD3) TaxID=340177 RepID=Q3AQ78_CHLCH
MPCVTQRIMAPSECLLAILTRNPELGQVKTRLAKAIGKEAALHIYELLRHRTAEVAQALASERMVFYSNYLPTSDCFSPTHFHYSLQAGADLGERMHHALASGLTAGFRSVVLIGTDCYDITPEILQAAFVALERYEVVIGPATDGGFYLIGMKQPMPHLFFQRKWSTSSVLKESCIRLQQAGTKYALLKELSDIDTLEDLQQSSLWLTPELDALRSLFEEKAAQPTRQQP